MGQKEVELFTEILASEKLGSYQNLSQRMSSAYGSDNPSLLWEQLQWNPWLAMAVYADMEHKDPAIAAALHTRKTNVLSKQRNILPFSESRRDRKVAEFVEESLDRYFLDFEGFLYEATDAIGKGVSIGEKIFVDGPDRVYISDVRFKPQHLFSFGETDIAGFSTASLMYPQTGPLQLRQGVHIGDLVLGAELPEEKFFVFSFNPKYGNRWGDPVDRNAFWPSWMKRASMKEWLRYQEKGSGVVIARYNDNAAKDEQEKAQSAATAVQEESAVAMPKKFNLEVHEMVRNIGTSHSEFVQTCDADIFRIYLGQTLTSRGSEGGGSRALGEVHERKEDSIAETDAKALIQVVNEQIIRPLVLYNFGPTADCPKWQIEYEPKEDLDSKAKRYAIARNELGLDLSKDQIREDLQLEEPKGDDDTLEAPVMSVPPAVAGGALSADKDTSEPRAVATGSSRAATNTDKTDLAEKKKTLPGSASPSNLRTARFTRFRPSTIEFSDE